MNSSVFLLLSNNVFLEKKKLIIIIITNEIIVKTIGTISFTNDILVICFPKKRKIGSKYSTNANIYAMIISPLKIALKYITLQL
jgi:hypothetical protein